MDERKIQKLLKKLDRIDTRNNPKENINIYHEIAEAYRSIGNYDQAIKYFQLELHESEQANLHDDILYCYRFLAECYLYKNQFTISEKYHLKFLTLAKTYSNNERLEQAYACLAYMYWLWFSYLQDDILYDEQCDELPRSLREKSFEAAEKSLEIINQLEIQNRERTFVRNKDRQDIENDLALRRVRSYINIANALGEKYINNNQDDVTLKSYSQYVRNAIELAKKHNLYQELARVHSSLSCFYLSLPNYLQYKKEILATIKNAIHYAELTKNTNDYLSCLYDMAQTLVSFDEYEQAKYYLLKIYRFKKSDHSIKENAMQDLANVQRLLTGLEDRYETESDLIRKMSLAEKCADTYACLSRPERSKLYYLKQLKHAQDLNLNELEMATIYSSLGSICQDLKEWQLSIDYFRREMSCRIGLGVSGDIEQGYSLCEIIKCEYRLKLDIESRIRTFKRVLTLVRSTNEENLTRKAVALIFAMKIRDSRIYLNDEFEDFMANIRPVINEENYSEILRCSNDFIEEDRINSIRNIQQLIPIDNNVNLPDCHGWTPLHKSVDSKNLEIVRHLLDENVDINARTNNGLTPLIIACYHGCLDLIELLLTYGAKANIRTKNGYTAVDYLVDYEKSMSIDDWRKFHQFKDLLLSTIQKDEPMYRIQAIGQSDFADKQISFRNRSHLRNRNLTKEKRVRSIQKYEPMDFDDDLWLINECDNRKRQRTITDDELEVIDIIPNDLSFQILTPARSRQASATSESNIIRIIRCTIKTNHPTTTTEQQKLRIPISSSDTITNLRYQIIKRLYDNFHICACFVTLYDREDWELGLSESDTIQFALPNDESEIKAIYIEKNPLLIYENFCRERNSFLYSNIRLVLKLFFDKHHLAFQRLSLPANQMKFLLNIFENFMFIYSINLSENHLTDEIIDELIKLTLDQLKTLNLSKNQLTSDGIRKLFEEKTLINLKTLDLTHNPAVDRQTIDFLRTRFPNLTIYH